MADGITIDTDQSSAMRLAWPRIATRCPSCGGQTLFVGAGGHLTCSVLGCKEPDVEAAIEALKEERDALRKALARTGGDLVRVEVGQVVRLEAVDWCRHEYQMDTALAHRDAKPKHAVLYGQVVRADDECIAICSEIFDEENDYRYVLAIPVGCIRAIRVLNAGAA